MDGRIRRGMRIFGEDGQRVGRVVAVAEEEVLASEGLLIKRRFRIGPEELRGVDAHGLRVSRRARPLHLQARDLEDARIDRARYQSARLPFAPVQWDGTTMSDLEHARMEKGRSLRERVSHQGALGHHDW